ncbi:FUSC family protein [Alicyclobacillus acidoterrestris]|uniref:Aromatic acid exporter family protein n=1 Tax=Alicyclobacillus acidoterrestris (strain ATCC 49025 / DSM 3922 / CIP 106132 / NCIMB 13137 / GD3B) TaxID=1356854 RepID=T0BS00_ALIAG|nr:aromatic acid exporter family protein [Alicyclobacillus acidoterrestris]EPZ43290.1 hypothetical protein N007_13410 [Alicyclobacillus acidoterrestris ATCC 49025]UNO47708.1 aromatic acid exporter family protein [Alicyclobacillus acidoterrestris]
MVRRFIAAKQNFAGLQMLVPVLGGRTLKTCVAILLSVFTAHLCHLSAPQFAGIVAVLAVQPSVHRSLRQGAQQLLSALIGAGAGVLCLSIFGPPSLVFALVALVLMGLHVRWGWTNSLLVAVVISLNTIGSQGMSHLHSGINQICLVSLGIGYGNLVNLLIRPAHGPRYEQLLLRSQREVFRLLRTIHKDLSRGVATPYVAFRRHLDNVRMMLDEGKRISVLMREDHKFHQETNPSFLHAFHTLESMVERIRDLNKSLQRLNEEQSQYELTRLVDVLIRVQRRVVWGRNCHFSFVDAAFRQVDDYFHTRTLPVDHTAFMTQASEYHLFVHLLEYYTKLKELMGEPSKSYPLAVHHAQRNAGA